MQTLPKDKLTPSLFSSAMYWSSLLQAAVPHHPSETPAQPCSAPSWTSQSPSEPSLPKPLWPTSPRLLTVLSAMLSESCPLQILLPGLWLSLRLERLLYVAMYAFADRTRLTELNRSWMECSTFLVTSSPTWPTRCGKTRGRPSLRSWTSSRSCYRLPMLSYCSLLLSTH